MAKDIQSAIRRSADTLLADMLGAASLVVILLGSLALPSLL